MRKLAVCGVLALFGTMAAPSFADGYPGDSPGIRLGFGVGNDVLKNDVEFAGVTSRTDGDRFGFSIFGGWTFNKWLAVEGAYRGGGSKFGDSDISTDLKAFEGSVLGSWWFNPKLSVYGRLGMYAWKGETTFRATGSSTETDGTDPIFGVGLQTEFDGALLRLEYQMVETGDVSLDTGVGTATARNNELTALQLSIVWFPH